MRRHIIIREDILVYAMRSFTVLICETKKYIFVLLFVNGCIFTAPEQATSANNAQGSFTSLKVLKEKQVAQFYEVLQCFVSIYGNFYVIFDTGTEHKLEIC